jgi:uncharacterized repeat protein (TIGR01451 family)
MVDRADDDSTASACTSDPNDCSLRGAISRANTAGDPDSIVFDPVFASGPVTVSLTLFESGALGPSALVIASDIDIEGPTSGGVTIARSAANNFRLFHVTAAGALTLRNLTLSNGNSVGGNGGSGAGGGGGGAGLGGAILNQGTLALDGITLSGNTARGGNGGSGGAAGLGGSGGGGSPPAPGGVDGGTGNGGPGATGSFGAGGGGGGHGDTQGGAGGSGGFGGGGGGGGHRSGAGGAGGFAGGGGGFASSTAGGGGGAGGGLGGAIFNHAGTLSITNSTLSNNMAAPGLGGPGGSGAAFGGTGQAMGGGLFNRNGSVSILNSTLSDNAAGQGGGGIVNLGDAGVATVSMTNSIVANTPGGVTDFQAVERFGGTSDTFGGSNNLIENNAGYFGGVASNADPSLGPLQDNGGPTFTRALLPGSPAIDTGSTTCPPPPTDQRGVGRPQGTACDIGSYEFIFSADLSLIKTDPPGRAPTGRNMTYTISVSNSGPDAASGVTVVDQLPSSVTFVSATPSQGTCAESGGTVTCNLGTMSASGTATVEIVVKPTTAGTITNTASVSASTPDPNQGNNTDSENTSVCRITSRRSSIPCP